MSTKKRLGSKKQHLASSSSSSSSDNGHDEITPRSLSYEKKTKRFVKKKGEIRRSNSIANSVTSKATKESIEIDKVNKELAKIKIESNFTAASNNNNNNNPKEIESKIEIARRFENFDTIKKEKIETREDEEEENVEISVNDEDDERRNIDSRVRSSTKKFDESKKADEEMRRERHAARFAKGVAKFSIKFMKAARDLGIFKPEDSSSSCSETASTSTGSSCTSSCTCSECCTTDSSTCSCSYCNSDSTGFSSSSGSSSSSSPSSPSNFGNSSASSNSGTSDTSSSSSSTSCSTSHIEK